MKKRRLIVAAKHFKDLQLVYEYVEHMPINDILVLMTSGTDDPAITIENTCIKRSVVVCKLKPNYEKYGEQAVNFRNGELAAMANEIVVFFDKESKNILNILKWAKLYDKPVVVFDARGKKLSLSKILPVKKPTEEQFTETVNEFGELLDNDD